MWKEGAWQSVPGRQANIAVYEAIDATDLHALITSLPLWPWMEVSIEALAVHPLEAGDPVAIGDEQVDGT